MEIRTLEADDQEGIEQAAEILHAALPLAWPDLAAGRIEVEECLEEGNICRAARDEAGDLLGWIGGRHQYARVWELHPLVVHPDVQERGVGRRLLQDLETQVRKLGALTLMLGTDDLDDQTSLAGIDLYPDVWTHLAQIRNLRRHPYEFYLKCGYVIVGVVPDANGPGRPDILMAKRVAGK